MVDNTDNLVLVLDCDGLIMDSIKLIEESAASVDFRCKRKYIDCIKACIKKKEDEITEKYYFEDHDTYDRLINDLRMTIDHYINISRITFDEVVEEVFPNYVDKMDYEFIYQISHAFRGVIEKIRELYHSKRFRKIYICTHCNSKNEIDAKTKFFREYLPMVEIIFVPFHDMPYIYDSSRYFENRERKRTNKPAYFFDITEENPLETIFMDDSPEICDEAEFLGAKAFHRDRTSPNPLHPFEEMEDFLDSKRYKKQV